MHAKSPVTHRVVRTFGTLSAAFLIAGTIQSAVAQQADVHWQPWIGCWKPADSLSQGSRDQLASDLVCVIPVGNSAVEFATIEDGQVVGRDTISVTSEKQPTSRGRCSGWENAEWSSVGARLYLRSERTCPGGLVRTSNGLMSITAQGEWLDVRGLAAGGNKGVRVLRYQEVDLGAISPRLPAEIAKALDNTGEAVSAARMAAGRRLVRDDIIEASRQMEANVVEAWLVENREGFRVDARDLVELANAGVPGSVTDLMIALSYPRVFALDRASRESEFRPAEPRAEVVTDSYSGGDGYSIWDGYSPFGYSPWDYGYGYGRGYRNGYGYGPGLGWYPGGQVIVIVPNNGTQPENTEEHGQVVKGRGYSRGHSDGSSSASETPSSRSSEGSSSSSSSDNSSSPPSSSTSSGGYSGSGSDTGRTAKPREN